MKFYMSILLASCLNTGFCAQADTTRTDTVYYDNGKIRFIGRYKYTADGEYFVRYKFFDLPDNMRDNWNEYARYFSLPNRVYDGYCTTWHDNGQLALAGTFNMGFPNGKFVLYYENGKKYGEGEFSNGIRINYWIEWYENGNKFMEGYYVPYTPQEADSIYNAKTSEDVIENLYKLEANPLKEEYAFFNDYLLDYFAVQAKKVGKFIIYYENGKIQAEGVFENNLPEGEWQFNQEDGSKDRILVFKHGEIIKRK